jgi:ligand-binding sensor domain-containing protein/two-component sensor histidine kinase
LTIAGNVRAERLPIRSYTIADGLPRDYISCIVPDTHGFLWFCTAEGLSRFDGYRFVNYGTEKGLPHRSVRDLLESSDGTYWVATGDGLVHFNPIETPSNGQLPNQSKLGGGVSSTTNRFTIYRPEGNEDNHSFNVLLQDQTNVIWGGTDAGLYKMEKTGGQWSLSSVDIGLPKNHWSSSVVAIIQDHQQALWIGTTNGLYHRFADGRVEHFTTREGIPFDDVRSLLEDDKGRVWVGTSLGLCSLLPEAERGKTVVDRVYGEQDGLPAKIVTSLFESDGELWVGTSGGLSRSVTSGSQQQFRSYTTGEGLSDKLVTKLAEDQAENLWIGTESGGAMKLARNGFTTYSEGDGLNGTRIASIFENRDGELFVVANKGYIQRFDGRGFVATKPNLPTQIKDAGWGWHQIAFQDRNGEWWVPTSQGLCRFARVSRIEQLAQTRPKALYTTRDGLTGDQIFRLYEDVRGDIWISTLDHEGSTLTRWDRATETFHPYTSADGMPGTAPTAFGEDRAGHLWIGFSGGGVVRYSSGHFAMFTPTDGLPAGMIRDLYLDQSGRLWIATGLGGLARVDDPTMENPRFVNYTVANGLASNQVTCITEDRQGRIYVGTGRGLDRLDLHTNRFKHYTAADGLGNNFVNVSFRDHQGVLWFGTLQGLARLIPADRPLSAPPILITALRVGGVAKTLSDLGERTLNGLVLEPDQNQFQIEFVGLSFGVGDTLRYQIKLEGADDDWSLPTEERAVNYARLAPGTYRFFVRAVNADGVVSATPASISFRVLPPIWQRWWFVLLSTLLLSGLIYVGYKFQVKRLLEIERVRVRIATDLHDDIGSSLSRMAILSEVVKQDSSVIHRESLERLTNIAETSRSLVDTMSDIVWSIDPRRDDVQSVVLRVRQFASDIFEPRGIRWEFHSPPELSRVKLSPEQRRHLFLIFKEALTNIVRHANSANVFLKIQTGKEQLQAEISDDGIGLSASTNPGSEVNGRGGHGLENMRARAKQIGGALEIYSTPCDGTKVTLTMPINRAYGMNMLFRLWRK